MTTELALIRDNPEALVAVFPATQGRVRLPMEPETYVHAPVAGWAGEGFRIAEVIAPAIPEGKQVSTDVGLVAGVPTYGLEDVPVPPVPDRVTSRQFFLQLAAAGLLDPVEAWIDTQPLPIQIAFERSGTFVRDDPMLQQGFEGLQFTVAQIDDFFVAAAAL
jgi:hypothetical protein